MPREYYISMEQAWMDLFEKGLLILTIGCGVIISVWLLVSCVTLLHRRHVRKQAQALRASQSRVVTNLGAYKVLRPSHQPIFHELLAGFDDLEFAQWNELPVSEATSYSASPTGDNY